MWTKQTIIVRISPSVMALEDAEKIALRYADRLYTARITSTSFRFRQRPPNCFVKGSFWPKRINEHVTIIFGRLKPSMTKKRSCKPKKKKKRRS